MFVGSISEPVVPLLMLTNRVNQRYLRRGLDGWKGKYQFPFNCLHRQPPSPSLPSLPSLPPATSLCCDGSVSSGRFDCCGQVVQVGVISSSVIFLAVLDILR